MPMPARTRITAPYGYSPEYRDGKVHHNGIDFAHVDPNNTPVFAFRAGAVVSFGRRPGWLLGNVLVIDHGDGIVSWSCHLASANVSPGDRVAEGQRVATMGMTDADAVHLHWVIWLNGQMVNPTPYLTSSAGDSTTPFEELIMPVLIRHPNSTIGFLSDAGMLDPISTMTEVESLQYTGVVGEIKAVTSLVWDTLTARTARIRPSTGGASGDNSEVLAAISKVPTADQNGAAARAAIVK